MLYLPPLRRLLLPSILCLAFILWYRSNVQIDTEQIAKYLIVQPELTPPGDRVAATEISATQLLYSNQSENYKTPAQHHYYHYNEAGATYDNGTEIEIKFEDARWNQHLQVLYECPFTPNEFTGHIRFKEPLRNITLVLHNETENEHKSSYLNPAIISLPHWSRNQYLLISRVGTDGSHQQNLLCEANICHAGKDDNAPPGEIECDQTELDLLGPGGGMRCATPPITLNVPPTPAENCGEGTGVLMDIPGFHDPRAFWSGKGEPLMMVNSQSRYACFGLWVIDLRKLHDPLEGLLASNPFNPSFGPLMSYPHLTEITRNPKETRGMIEKNWMFFGDEHGSYVHYDLGPQKRSFAKLLGGGITTPNLTDSREMPCLEDAEAAVEEGSWHQGTNALRLTLCKRTDRGCKPTFDNQVYFALVHHKIKSDYGLPMRYERYFIVWQAHPPFSMLGISKHPLLFANETAHPWTDFENWYGDEDNDARLARGEPSKGMFAVFTYTVSIAWAWGRKLDEPKDKMMGYLDDDVVLGVGIDDMAMVYAKIKAQDLLSCLRACPERAPSPLYVSPSEHAAIQDQQQGAALEEFKLPTASRDAEAAASSELESILQNVVSVTDAAAAVASMMSDWHEDDVEARATGADATLTAATTAARVSATATSGPQATTGREYTLSSSEIDERSIATAPLVSHTRTAMSVRNPEETLESASISASSAAATGTDSTSASSIASTSRSSISSSNAGSSESTTATRAPGATTGSTSSGSSLSLTASISNSATTSTSSASIASATSNSESQNTVSSTSASSGSVSSSPASSSSLSSSSSSSGSTSARATGSTTSQSSETAVVSSQGSTESSSLTSSTITGFETSSTSSTAEP